MTFKLNDDRATCGVILAAALAGIASLTAAPSPAEAAPPATCEAVADLASTAIYIRSEGVALSDALAAVGDGDGIPALAAMILRDAYAEPRFTTDDVLRRQREEFRTRWHLWCLDA